MLQQILPVFIIIAVGFVLSLLKIANTSWVNILNKYGLYVGFPALIFVNITTLDRGMLKAQMPTFFATIIILAAVMLLLAAAIKMMKLSTGIGTALFLGAYNGNIGYLGYPLVIAVLPNAGATVGLIIGAYSITTFSLGLFILEYLSGDERHITDIIKAVFTSPFLIAAFAGLLAVLLNIKTPEPIYKTLKMAEASASPVVLIGLGIFIQRKFNLKAVLKPAVIIFTLKMAVFPLIFFAVGRLFNIGQSFDAAILEAMMPVGITNFALSDRYPIDKELMVSIIMLTTIATPLIYPLFASII
jgi:predicted permease